MPPYPMMPFAVDAFLKLREEASAKFAEWRAMLSRQVPAEVTEPEAEGRSIPMPATSARRAA